MDFLYCASAQGDDVVLSGSSDPTAVPTPRQPKTMLEVNVWSDETSARLILRLELAMSIDDPLRRSGCTRGEGNGCNI